MAYSKKVIEKFENTLKNPSAFNVGRLDPKKKNVGTGMVGAPACGDVMRLQIEVNEKNVITDCKFKTYGCGSAIASSPTPFVRRVERRSSRASTPIRMVFTSSRQ